MLILQILKDKIMADINMRDVKIKVNDSSDVNIGVMGSNKTSSNNKPKDDDVIPSLITQVYENKIVTVIILILVLAILLVFKFG